MAGFVMILKTWIGLLSTYCIFRENTPGAASSAALRGLPCTEEGVLFQHILNTEPFSKIYRTVYGCYPQTPGVFCKITQFNQGRKLPPTGLTKLEKARLVAISKPAKPKKS